MKATHNSKPIKMAKEYKQKLIEELQVPIEMTFTTVCGVLYAIYSYCNVKFDEIALIF